MSRALDEHVVDFEAGDGAPLRLTRLRGAATHRGPVMLVHGAGVRSRLFRPPVKTSIVDLLTEHGYEVWLLDWRASIDLPPRPWSLDDAALHDHPVAVKRVVKETGAKEIKALVHCQGSTSFTMAAIAGLVPEVTTVVTNAVSLHPIVSAGGRLKLGLLLPMVAAVTPSLDPRWGAEAHGFVPRACAAYANLTHRHCDNRVCKMVSFVYGYGDPALWSHEMISEATHEWLTREFGSVSLRLHQQLSRCVSAGHLVSLDVQGGLVADYAASPPKTSARFSFFAGEQNRCFLPQSQIESHAWFVKSSPRAHTLHVLPRFGHLDVFFGDDAARDVFPLMIDELDRGNPTTETSA